MKFLAWKQVYRSPENDGAGGGSGTSGGDGSNTGANGGANDGAKGAGNNGTSGNQNNNGNGDQNTGAQDDGKKFSQADLDRILSERLGREREKQEREAREKQGEFEKLYGEFKPKFESALQENETLKARLQALETAGHNQIDNLIKDWPKEVKDFDPGKDSLESRQAWVERAKSLAQKLQTTEKAPDLEGGEKGKASGTASSFASSFMSRRYGVTENKKA